MKWISLIFALSFTTPVYAQNCAGGDQAKIVRAERMIARYQYSDATIELNKVSPLCKLNRKVRLLTGQSNFGQCVGPIDAFMVEYEKLQSQTPLQKAFHLTAVKDFGQSVYCTNASRSIKQISPNPNDFDTDEARLMAFIQLASLGFLVSDTADHSNDGQIDEAFNACNSSSIRSDQLKTMILTYLDMYKLRQLFDDPVIGTDYLVFHEMCISSDISFPGSGFCNIRFITEINDQHQNIMRSMINESKMFGLGNSCTGTLSFCQCK